MGVRMVEEIVLSDNLIVNNIPVHTTNIVDIEGSSIQNYLVTGVYDPTVYQFFSTISSENLLNNPDIIKTEIDLFIQYAEALTNNQSVPVGFSELNNYLGSLGV